MEAHVDLWKLALQWLNFGVLIFLLVRYGGGGIREMLRNRHLQVKKEIEEARALREQAEQRLREYETRLANIEHEIGDLLAGIRKEAEEDKARMLRSAEEGALRMKREAEFSVKQEARRLEIELRREAALLAVELAKQLLGKKLTDADQRRLAEEFVKKLAGSQTVREPDDKALEALESGWDIA